MKRLPEYTAMTALTLFLAVLIPACAEGSGPVVGKRAPDVTLSAPDGRTAKLSDYRGKPVVLHFWATWCGPCVRELPLIAELGARNSADLTVLAVNCAETDQEVASFLAGMKLTLNVMMDRDFLVSKTYNVDAIPQTYLIDSEGIIKSIRVGAYTRPELDRDLAALFGP
ncbi:MAG: TlpA family protein disulfide reductase [Treponema sp.]|jgi:thiol-disulfide isomerase/thioredoxin|nr:TlpA family protein disulfide reductase [Treponema sp.]